GRLSTGGQRVGVTLASNHQVCAVISNAADLGWRRHGRNEDSRLYSEGVRGINDGRPVVSAGSSHHTRRRQITHEQIGKRAARLEGARVLELFELQRQREVGETKVETI